MRNCNEFNLPELFSWYISDGNKNKKEKYLRAYAFGNIHLA